MGPSGITTTPLELAPETYLRTPNFYLVSFGPSRVGPVVGTWNLCMRLSGRRPCPVGTSPTGGRTGRRAGGGPPGPGAAGRTRTVAGSGSRGSSTCRPSRRGCKRDFLWRKKEVPDEERDKLPSQTDSKGGHHRTPVTVRLLTGCGSGPRRRRAPNI